MLTIIALVLKLCFVKHHLIEFLQFKLIKTWLFTFSVKKINAHT